jgi:hypothetical protein
MSRYNDDKKDGTLGEFRKIYEQPEIPETLSQVVRNTIERVEKEEKSVEESTGKNNHKRKPYWKAFAGIAAAIAVVICALGIGITTNETFAASLEDTPILGGLVKIFTAHEVHEEDGVSAINLKIPEVEGLKDRNLQEKINKDVDKDVSRAVKETKKILADYKKARLETGTAQEDYVPTELTVDYEVKCNSKDYLSFKAWVAQNFASAYYQEFYYNYDLNKGSRVTLEDLLGKDYTDVANQQISAEIAERSKNPDNTFFSHSEGGFQSIRADQPFYVNQNGNPVILFAKYEIAPGYMGMPEFEIKRP